jgi:hypothetical protein
MAEPTLPVAVPAEVRQGSEDGYDTTMPLSEGFSQSHRGRGRKDIPLYGQQPKGHMEGNWDL